MYKLEAFVQTKVVWEGVDSMYKLKAFVQTKVVVHVMIQEN